MDRASLLMLIAKRLVALLALAGAYLLVVYLLQRRMLFPAPRLNTPWTGDRAELISIPQPSGATEALFLPSRSSTGLPAPLLVFTHGNAETVDDWVGEFGEPRSWGWAVLLVEYPGYGRSAGSPSEESINSAVRAAYQWARADPRIDATRIVAYGRSVGGGPAARLAADQSLPALILESAFTSVRPFARRMLAPGFLVRDPFDNVAALERYRGAVMILHGRDDEVIPVAHGRELSRASPRAEYHELPCGHNDCPRSWAVVQRFLAANGLMPPQPSR